MSPLGEAFRRALEKGGASAREGTTGAAPSGRLAHPSAPTQEIPVYPSAPPAGGGSGRAGGRPVSARGTAPPSQGPYVEPGGASAFLSHATRVPTFAEGPLPAGSDELAGLRASLLALGLDRPPASVMVAGTASGPQTTAVAIGLASELARDLAHQVLLVDANVASPGAARMLDVDPAVELADVLEGRAFAGEAIVHSETDNLSALVLRPDAMVGGSRVSAEAFLSDIARQAFAEIQAAFDYVIIDAGASGASAVPRVMASRVTGTVLVVSSGVAREVALAAKRAIEGGGGRVLGVVLAGVATAAPSRGGSTRGPLGGAPVGTRRGAWNDAGRGL